VRSMMRNVGAVAIVVLGLTLSAVPEARAGWKLVHWNVQSGFGKAGWISAGVGFTQGSDCSKNAWGNGYGPLAKTLVTQAKDDPDVVAVTLNEAWTCATPRRIRALLGFAAVAPDWTTAGEVAGVSIVARYGFAGPSKVKALPKCSSTADQFYVVSAPVYVDAARTRVVHVYATHWKGCTAEAQATVDFMQENAYKPRALTGDLNIKDPSAPGIQTPRNANYKDVWALLYGTAAGHTGCWNNEWGTPTGNLYKRIDYAFAKTLTPLSMTRFNTTGEPGVTKQADHAGLKIEYAY
jgi:hypothetical protein